jgi:hypothetical protein
LYLIISHYRYPFRPALARARGGPLNFVSGQPGPDSHRTVSCPLTGCADGPSPGSSCHFVSDQQEVAQPYTCSQAARSLRRGSGAVIERRGRRPATGERSGGLLPLLLGDKGAAVEWMEGRADRPWLVGEIEKAVEGQVGDLIVLPPITNITLQARRQRPSMASPPASSSCCATASKEGEHRPASRRAPPGSSTPRPAPLAEGERRLLPH